MSEISNIGMGNLYAPAQRAANSALATASDRLGQAQGLGETDPVEFSRMGRMMAGAADTSSLRLAKIQALRAEIADGTFETQERIEGTVEQLFKVLD